MGSITFRAELQGTLEDSITRTTEALKQEGFGVLTRIDLHTKFQEKLGKAVDPVVILGACNPQLAFEAFRANPDVTALLPCNAVIRGIGPNRTSVELAKPSALMSVLGEPGLVELARKGDSSLERVLKRLGG